MNFQLYFFHFSRWNCSTISYNHILIDVERFLMLSLYLFQLIIQLFVVHFLPIYFLIKLINDLFSFNRDVFSNTFSYIHYIIIYFNRDVFSYSFSYIHCKNLYLKRYVLSYSFSYIHCIKFFSVVLIPITF